MYHFIVNVNSKSGKGLHTWIEVKEELDKRHIEYLCYFTKYIGHAKELAAEVCNKNKGIKTIIVLGGDGTMDEVVNGVPMLDEIIFGYIPTGSSNDFARSLKISTDALTALNQILNPSHFDYLDIGEVTFDQEKTVRFCVSSGVGFDAAVCDETFRTPLKKVLNRFGFGKLTYIIICIKQLLFSEFMNGYVIKEDGSVVHYKNMLLLTSMIHRYQGGGVEMCPGTDPRDGLLSVCLVHDLNRLKALCILPSLSVGKHTKFKGVETFKCKRIKLHVDQPHFLHHDGECPGRFTDFEVICQPKKIRVIL